MSRSTASQQRRSIERYGIERHRERSRIYQHLSRARRSQAAGIPLTDAQVAACFAALRMTPRLKASAERVFSRTPGFPAKARHFPNAAGSVFVWSKDTTKCRYGLETKA